MLRTALLALAAIAASAPAEPPTSVPPGALAPEGMSTHEGVATRLRALAGTVPGRASIETIATSRQGRAIELLLLGEQDPAKRMPAMLLVAGMDGVNLASTEQCLVAVESMLREHGDALGAMRVFVIAEANPDARHDAIARRMPRATNGRVVDDDRDGAADEDGPSDANGDGVVTMIRRVAPPGEPATHLVDAVDPRVVRAPDREKGEIATHQVFVEGTDRDGDGRVAEDAAGGVDLDRNFPHRWPEFEPDAGPYQLSEPESRGIAEFVRAHPEITTAVVFGRHDTLARFPDTKDKDATGRTPMVYHPDDHALYRQFAKLWKDETGIESSAQADLSGSLVLWLANHRGIAAVAANGWNRPEAPKPPAKEATDEAPKEAATEATTEAAAGDASATPEPDQESKPLESGDAEQSAWLLVAEKLYGAGFVDWKPFQHPVYGACEIGGFAPFLRESPTLAQAQDLGTRSARFIAALATKRPEIRASDARLTPLAGGLARLEFRVTNTGNIATTTEMGRITEMVPPIVVRLAQAGKPLSPDAVLNGRPVEKIDRLQAGASREFSWLVRVPGGGPLEIAVSGPFFDEIRTTAAPAAGNGGAR
jgi:hypothetical protein